MIKQKQKLSTPGAYVAPACEALELSVQGVICQSGDFGINGFGDDDGDPLDGFIGL